MKRNGSVLDLVVLAVLIGVLCLFASLGRPSQGEAQPEGPAPRAATEVGTPWARVTSAAREVRESLEAQPDVAAAEVSVFTPEARPLLVLVTVRWASPAPPPLQRLDTIARWVQARVGAGERCFVHVVDDERRHILNDPPSPSDSQPDSSSAESTLHQGEGERLRRVSPQRR